MVEIEVCPVENTVSIIRKKWTLQIIANMLHGQNRFNEILNHNKGLTPKVLSNRLKDLLSNGIISRHIISDSPLETEYQLTPIGFELRDLIFNIAMFSVRAFPKKIFGKIGGSIPIQFSKDECLREQIEDIETPKVTVSRFHRHN